ncbi:MAG: ArnT family glycosyltransferase [Caulobacterales bacterium]
MRAETKDVAALPAQDWLDRAIAGWRAYVLLGALTIAAVLPGFFSIPPLDRDESRFAQATAQMLETKDFVRINVQDDPRNKKPVGIHWLQAASVAALSKVEAREIWAYRMPSLLGAALAVLAAFWGGTALVGRRAAFFGAAMLGVCLLLSTEGMIAKTDAMLCGLTTLCLAALARLRNPPRHPLRLALIAWGALGAGVLIKGPITPMVMGLTLLALALWERRAAWMKTLAHWSGPLLAAVIVLPWMIAIGVATDGRFFAEAIGQDLGNKVTAGGEHAFTPPGVHLLLLSLLIFPATVALPGAARLAFSALRARRDDASFADERFLLAWIIPSFAVFELMPVKLAHYPLPTYPAIALLCGAGLLALFQPGWRKTRWVALALSAFAAAGLAALCAYLATYAPGDPLASDQRALQTGMIVGAGALALVVGLAGARTAPTYLVIALIAGLGFVFTARERILPEARKLLVSREVASALAREGLHPRLSPGAGPLIVSGYREPSLVFMTRTDVALWSGNEAGERGEASQNAVIEARELAAFQSGLKARGLGFALKGEPVRGLNYSNGDEVSLQLGTIVPASP